MTNKIQPAVVVPENLFIPPTLLRKAPNGVKIHLVNCTDDEVIRVSFVFHAGTAYQDMPFQASATANMLSEGTQKYSSQEISEKLDFMGSYFEISMDRDFVVVTFCCLSKFFSDTMDIAQEIILHPVFPQNELDTYCSKRKQRLAIERSKVGFRSREYLSRALFGANHPYGESYPGEDYDKLTTESLKLFYKKMYNASNSFVVCSGMLPADICDSIFAIASQIPTGNGVSHIEFPTPVTEKYFYERQPGAVQSAIRIGTLLFTRSHPDFIAMQVVTTLLGGYFGSRLVRNLREEHGYTYGVFAGVVNLDRDGYFAVGTEVAADVTQDAIDQIFIEIEKMCTDTVPENELAMVRNIIVGEVMRVLDGPFGIADVTIENAQNGLDNSYLNRLLQEVKTITAERILEVSRKYLARENFTTVIVGEGLPE